MATPTFILFHPEKVAANPADALVIASNALAALSVSVERVRIEDMDRSSANGFRTLFDAIRGTIDTAAEEVRAMTAQDAVLPMITSAQCREARNLLGWSQKELSTRFGRLNESKISIFERSGGMHGNARRKLAKLFSDVGIQFLPDGTVRLGPPTSPLPVEGE